jgi:NADH-quinone oxidoreductase subunit G
MDIGTSAGNERISAWKNFEDVTNAIAREETLLKRITEITPPSSFRLAGQRIPRQPHRYSGRTSMNANQQVSEPKPPEDPDSALSYTMEGYRGMPPSSMIPFVWSPGWNSVQSLNKYQESIGKALRGGDPGVRLIAPAISKSTPYFQGVPEAFRPMEDHLWIVPIHHIFGSEELSARSPSVAQRIPAPYILLHTQDVADLKLREGENFIFHIHGQTYSLPVKISTSMVKGVAAVPYGIGNTPYAVLPEWAIIKGYVPEPVYKSTQLNT